MLFLSSSKKSSVLVAINCCYSVVIVALICFSYYSSWNCGEEKDVWHHIVIFLVLCCICPCILLSQKVVLRGPCVVDRALYLITHSYNMKRILTGLGEHNVSYFKYVLKSKCLKKSWCQFHLTEGKRCNCKMLCVKCSLFGCYLTLWKTVCHHFERKHWF